MQLNSAQKGINDSGRPKSPIIRPLFNLESPSLAWTSRLTWTKPHYMTTPVICLVIRDHYCFQTPSITRRSFLSSLSPLSILARQHFFTTVYVDDCLCCYLFRHLLAHWSVYFWYFDWLVKQNNSYQTEIGTEHLLTVFPGHSTHRNTSTTRVASHWLDYLQRWQRGSTKWTVWYRTEASRGAEPVWKSQENRHQQRG